MAQQELGAFNRLAIDAQPIFGIVFDLDSQISENALNDRFFDNIASQVDVLFSRNAWRR